MGNNKGRQSVKLEKRETVYKQKQHILHAFEEKYAPIFDSIAEGITITDLAGNIREINEAAIRLHGYDSKQELIGRSAFDLIASKDHPRAIKNMKRTLDKGSVRNIQYTFLLKDGHEFDAELSAAVIKDARGNPQGFVAVTRDITERKQMEDALWKSREWYRNLFENSQAGIASINLEGRFIYVNNGLCEIVGLSKKEILNRHFAEIIYPDDRQKILKKYSRGYKINQKMVDLEFRIMHKSGRIIYVNTTPTAFSIDNNELQGFFSIIIDITKRKEAEAQLLAYQTKLRSLASQISVAEQRERRRIAMAVHDNVGQNLALCNIKLGFLLETVPSAYVNYLQEIRSIIQQLIEDLRALTHELASLGLYKFGLGAALKSLGDEIFKPQGIEYLFEEDSQPKPLDENALALLHQIVRELYFNIIKHAQAHKVRVSIKSCNNNIKIIVKDDGVGFDVTAVTSGKEGDNGFGLFSVRERITYISGSIKIESEPGHGTRVTLVVPLKREPVE